GITGGILMIYYQPTLAGCGNTTCAFQSVERINNTVPFGWLLRNIHYTASNAMVLLAVLHLYYQYFSGRFKIKNEVLWVTGVIFGLITGIEAYTGYDLIFNQRAGLAIEIGASLANASPVIGAPLRLATFGAGFADFILRLYSAHVFILPMIMLILVFIHFPRYLVFDIPVVSVVVGGLFMIAGVFPAELGLQYNPGLGQITVPEWYVNALYALLRIAYAYLRYLKAKERVRRAVAPLKPLLNRRWLLIIFILLLGSQVALNGMAVMAIQAGFNGIALFQVGSILVAFGVIVHLYRYSQ